MLINKPQQMNVAKEIFKQLGGRRFEVMTGSHTFGAKKNGLTMRLRRNSTSANYLTITLNVSDLYDMEFVSVRGSKIKVIRTYNDVYNDQLQQLFTEVTGLYTSL